VNNKIPVVVVAAVIQREEDPQRKILLVRRGPGQSGTGFWEFPGGKVEPGESSEQALRREIEEELNIKIEVGAFIGEKDFAYPNKTVRLRLYWALCHHQQIQLSEHDALQWVLPEEIPVNALSAADRPFVALLQGKR